MCLAYMCWKLKKGGRLCLNGGKEQGTWIQCAHCGEVYWTKEDVLIDRLYVTSYCPGCDEYGKGLNCGSDESDIYVYMNENYDPRYYTY